MFPSRQRSPWIARLAAGLAVLLIGIWLGGHPSWLPRPVRSALTASSANDRLIDQVLGLIQADYYRPVNRSQLVDKGLAAAVASLDDPYSHYYDPADYAAFQNQDDPQDRGGIGVNIDPAPQPQGLLVDDVFPDSPAQRAGLRRGDLIVAVGSRPLANRSVDYSAGLIRGAPGTRVTLTVLRGHARMVLTLDRADVAVPVSTGRIISYHGRRLGYVQLTSFTQGSGDQLRQNVRSVISQGAQGLVLDLRDNGGGLLEEAVNVASIFIPNGTIVSTDGRAQPRQVYMARGDAIAPTIPMVVLVDSGTASSAEIVTAALQQRGRATVVGTHTYGKGVFQEIEPLPNGGALDFTVGEFYTPNGENLGAGGVRRGAGIKPDVYAVTLPTARTDTALDVALRTVAARAQ